MEKEKYHGKNADSRRTTGVKRRTSTKRATSLQRKTGTKRAAGIKRETGAKRTTGIKRAASTRRKQGASIIKIIFAAEAILVVLVLIALVCVKLWVKGRDTVQTALVSMETGSEEGQAGVEGVRMAEGEAAAEPDFCHIARRRRNPPIISNTQRSMWTGQL